MLSPKKTLPSATPTNLARPLNASQRISQQPPRIPNTSRTLNEVRTNSERTQNELRRTQNELRTNSERTQNELRTNS
ncbi:hypothetical protein, partial [Capnocytophaga haemolytica]